MYAQKEKPAGSKSRAVANSVAQKQSGVKQGVGFVDNRPESVAQRKLQDISNNNSKINQLKPVIQMGTGMSRMAGPAIRKTLPEGAVLWRVDTRPVQEIKKVGFGPWVGKKPNVKITIEELKKYQISNAENPGITSTSDSQDGVTSFADEHGPGYTTNLYKINAEGLGYYPVNENIPFLTRIFYANQQEIMVEGDIAPERIQHVEEYVVGQNMPSPFE